MKCYIVIYGNRVLVTLVRCPLEVVRWKADCFQPQKSTLLNACANFVQWNRETLFCSRNASVISNNLSQRHASVCCWYCHVSTWREPHPDTNNKFLAYAIVVRIEANFRDGFIVKCKKFESLKQWREFLPLFSILHFSYNIRNVFSRLTDKCQAQTYKFWLNCPKRLLRIHIQIRPVIHLMESPVKYILCDCHSLVASHHPDHDGLDMKSIEHKTVFLNLANIKSQPVSQAALSSRMLVLSSVEKVII